MNEQASRDVLAPLADAGLDAATLAVLRQLERRADVSQRDLSRVLGISLGKTHYVVRALLDKGLVKVDNFRRSDRKLAYAYVLTAAGLKEKVRLTRAFLSRKEAEFELLRTTIDRLRSELRDDHKEGNER